MHELKKLWFQVRWWLQTTCAHPKSVCLPTAIAATVATTRTSVTSSLSFSPRTPASVSNPSDQLLSVLFSSLLFYSSSGLSVLLSSVLLLSIFIRSAQRALFLFRTFILSFLSLSLLLSVSPSHEKYPIAMLALLFLHYRETSHTAPQHLNVCVPESCSRSAAPDLWQKAAFSSKPLTQWLSLTTPLKHTHSVSFYPTYTYTKSRISSQD